MRNLLGYSELLLVMYFVVHEVDTLKTFLLRGDMKIVDQHTRSTVRPYTRP